MPLWRGAAEVRVVRVSVGVPVLGEARAPERGRDGHGERRGLRVEAVRGECHVVDGATDPDPADRQIEVGLTCAERSFL